MSNVTISRELLQKLISFAEISERIPEWNRLVEQARAILAAPEPAPADTVTYTVYWQGRVYSGVDAEGVTRNEALDLVLFGNTQWRRAINHWAVGTDGSIIGRVGAPE